MNLFNVHVVCVENFIHGQVISPSFPTQKIFIDRLDVKHTVSEVAWWKRFSVSMCHCNKVLRFFVPKQSKDGSANVYFTFFADRQNFCALELVMNLDSCKSIANSAMQGCHNMRLHSTLNRCNMRQYGLNNFPKAPVDEDNAWRKFGHGALDDVFRDIKLGFLLGTPRKRSPALLKCFSPLPLAHLVQPACASRWTAPSFRFSWIEVWKECLYCRIPRCVHSSTVQWKIARKQTTSVIMPVLFTIDFWERQACKAVFKMGLHHVFSLWHRKQRLCCFRLLFFKLLDDQRRSLSIADYKKRLVWTWLTGLGDEAKSLMEWFLDYKRPGKQMKMPQKQREEGRGVIGCIGRCVLWSVLRKEKGCGKGLEKQERAIFGYLGCMRRSCLKCRGVGRIWSLLRPAKLCELLMCRIYCASVCNSAPYVLEIDKEDSKRTTSTSPSVVSWCSWSTRRIEEEREIRPSRTTNFLWFSWHGTGHHHSSRIYVLH